MEDPLKELEELKNLITKLNEEVDYSDILKNFGDDNSISDTFTPNNLKIITKFTNNSNNPDPEYAKVGDSGFDLRAFLDAPITLLPLKRSLIPTGLRFELPPNTELQVRPRSGMALKHGISVLNTPGTVDEGYRGEVGIIVVNLSNDPLKTENLNETERGDDGFGSTGK